MLGGVLYARGTYSEGGTYMPINTVVPGPLGGVVIEQIRLAGGEVVFPLYLPTNGVGVIHVSVNE